MLAIVKAIKTWRPYLLGKPFTVHTNQKSLKYQLEQRITTPAQTRWLQKMLGYDYEIKYKKGPENQGADSLSRVVKFQLLSISMPRADWWPIFKKKFNMIHFTGIYLKGVLPIHVTSFSNVMVFGSNAIKFI